MSNIRVKIAFVVVLLSITALASTPSAKTEAGWNVFSNGTGWSIQYPADWTAEGCKTCMEPTAPAAYVNFFPPAELETEGSVMVEPLADKPAEVSVDAWLEEMPARGGHNPLRKETRMTLNGSPAIDVRYRTGSGDDKEAVYVVCGAKTFAIEFSTEQPRVLVDRLANYPVFEEMVQSFQVGESN
jgi:hypothetical protein